MFSYLEGEVPDELDPGLSDATLVAAARLVRRFHDATPLPLQRCEDEPVIVREQQADDYEVIRHVYAEAFRRPRFRPP